MAGDDTKHRKIMREAAAAVVAVASHRCGILIVEADPDLQWRLARTLTEEGHRVVGTSSGDGALALISQWPVELVLVDEQLPSTTGLELARQIRERYPELAVVLMATDCDDVSSQVDEVGAMACVTKPLRFAALVAALEHAGAPVGAAE